MKLSKLTKTIIVVGKEVCSSRRHDIQLNICILNFMDEFPSTWKKYLSFQNLEFPSPLALVSAVWMSSTFPGCISGAPAGSHSCSGFGVITEGLPYGTYWLPLFQPMCILELLTGQVVIMALFRKHSNLFSTSCRTKVRAKAPSRPTEYYCY